MEVHFYTKENCSLCEQAETVLNMLHSEQLITCVHRIDIGESDELIERFQLRIPVVAANDGIVLAEGAVSYGEIAASLSS
ncbi:glutaredoxin family protein [Salisediminibacterium halotolerans]|uniref:Glutaredoxin-like domain n=1 Tax=Salisediminibacterium halotolerans TaxID=517425 RepID=A0A1H9WSC6_9BACI|nr:glutaredoxin family protein [Salisediminibacterium haloalkalitolerans]SES36689.1 Glutaredoxin-like domain [Salisediminibacterium haloalkalitolerans]